MAYFPGKWKCVAGDKMEQQEGALLSVAGGKP